MNFSGEVANGTPSWDDFWVTADPGSGGIERARDRRSVGGTLPLEITIQIRSAGETPDLSVEKIVEPFHETDYSNRIGYEEDFLGIPAPMPTVRRKSAMSKLPDGSHVLPYEHFSVVVNKGRRLAQFTASNVDAAKDKKEPEPGKSYTRTSLGGLDPKNDTERWFTGPADPGRRPAPRSLLHEGPPGVRPRPHRAARGRCLGRQLRPGEASERRHLPRDQLLTTGDGLQPVEGGRALGRAREPRPQAGRDRALLPPRRADLPQGRPDLRRRGRRRRDNGPDSEAVLEDRRGAQGRRARRPSRSSSSRTSPPRTSASSSSRSTTCGASA